MKKLIQIGLSSILVFPVMALGVCAANWNDNTTSMVTYFPVPYAAYNNIYVSDKFDVGTSTSNFQLNLGSGEIEQRALEANTVTLRSTEGVNAQFTINSDVYTPVAYFGNVKNPTGTTATLQFKDLRIGSQPAISTLTVNNEQSHTLKLQALNLFGANLGGATCNGTVQTKTLNLGAGSQKYMVCCPTGESCGTPCYFTDTEANSRKPKCLESSGHPAGSWVQNSSPDPECGCNCPAHSKLVNDKCQCDLDYSYSGGACVLSCSLDEYRKNNRAKCCPSYSGSNYADSVCWNLRWELTDEDGDVCSGISASSDNCSTVDTEEWDYVTPGAPVGAEEGDPCSTPNSSFLRTRYTGFQCSGGTTCAVVEETYTCKNQISW